jgi:glutaredoxin
MGIVIYVKPGCPYCQQARDYYNSQGTPFTEYDAQTDRARRKEMLAFSDGDPTVPCIVETASTSGSGGARPRAVEQCTTKAGREPAQERWVRGKG